MKKIVQSIALFVAIFCISVSNSAGFSQGTAVNFSCDDCHGVSHDLFTELNAGKVVVIAWVMPCGGCINGALAAHSAVQNYASSHPGEVLFYLVDDYGNTSCSSLGGWAENNGMTEFTPFSNAVISMSDYGTDGMPKVVVLGGSNHTVFYNENNQAIDAVNISNAIALALAAASLEENSTADEPVLYPNPGNAECSIHTEALGMKGKPEISIVLKNAAGKEVLPVFHGKLNPSQETIQFDTAQLANGNYFLHCSAEGISKVVKVVIAH